MRRPLVAGNWKMNGTKESVAALLTGLRGSCERVEVAELAVCVPFVFIDQVQQSLQRSQIVWGAQNVSDHADGAYTGEISTAMLKAFDCTYVIVGHSERRAMYHETNELVAAKFFKALKAGLKPILCVGETLEQREAGKTLEIIKEQLAAVLNLADNHNQLKHAVVAYEPVWAIGTGKQASPEQAQEVHAFIRSELKAVDQVLSSETRILYGGSMKPSNAKSLLAMPDVDGGLIGGASLNADDFIEIGLLCNN